MGYRYYGVVVKKTMLDVGLVNGMSFEALAPDSGIVLSNEQLLPA